MKPALLIVLLMPTLLIAPLAAQAQDACVTQALSLLVYYEDATETAANINQNILPPPPTTEAPDEEAGEPEAPAPEPLPSPTPADCPTLTLAASDARAQTACKIADDLPGARCVRLWSGLTLVIEPFD